MGDQYWYCFQNNKGAFAYVKKHLQSKVVFYSEPRDWSDIEWVSRDWSEFYPDVKGELLPPNMPEPRGNPVQINMWCDASHGTDLITRWSTTGIIFFVNGSPTLWYSQRQNTIEASTFGSEFVTGHMPHVVCWTRNGSMYGSRASARFQVAIIAYG